MWNYHQKSGILDHNGEISGAGYSGAPDAVNDPSKQNLKNVGPIPRGLYTIGTPFDSAKHGPHAMALVPDAGNRMFDRAGFLMHGDSREHPGCASEGCIIMPPNVRTKVSDSEDNRLTVVE